MDGTRDAFLVKVAESAISKTSCEPLNRASFLGTKRFQRYLHRSCISNLQSCIGFINCVNIECVLEEVFDLCVTAFTDGTFKSQHLSGRYTVVFNQLLFHFPAFAVVVQQARESITDA